MLLALLSLTATDFDSLDRSVARCAKDEVRPVFTNEAARRSEFLTEAYREQEAIVAARLDISDRRRALREGVKSSDSDGALTLQAAAIEDRQRALNDKRLLENLRGDAMDAKRRYYLAHCANGKD